MLHRRRRTPAALFAVVIIAALAVGGAGCGSSSSSSSGGGGGGSATSGSTKASASTKGAPIQIGMLCSCSGSASSSLGQIPTLVNVWESAVNNSGGINGHPVKVLLKDVAESPAEAQAAVRELVTQDKVMAVVGSFTTIAPTFQPYLAAHGIPTVGGQPDDVKTETSPLFFPSGGNHAGLVYGMAAQAQKDGNDKFAIMYCAEYPACGVLVPAWKTIMNSLGGGMEMTYAGEISASQPNYTAQCLGAKSNGADATFIAHASATIMRVIDDCAQQGVKLHQYNVSAAVTTELAKDPNAQGMKVTYINPPVSDTSTPGGKYLNAMIDKYAPQARNSPEWTQGLTTVWAGLQLFRQAAKLGHIGPSSTPEDVLNGLYQIKDDTLDGLSPPLTFVRGKGTHVDCWYVGTLEDSKIELSSTKPSCIPPSQQPVIEKEFGG